MRGLDLQCAVVVGVDGSAAAMHAALWALDEAVSRDVPLRLVHVVEAEDLEPDGIGRKRADAERAVRQIVKAVESTGKPVKIEVDIVRGGAASTLIRLSREAAMVCLGAVGSNPLQHGRIGSTAVAVARSAHCTVAVIHGSTRATRSHPQKVILAATDDSPDDGVLLQTAVQEAALRDAPLRVIACWQPPRSDPEATKEGDRRIQAQLRRRLARWQHMYPDVRVEPLAAHGSLPEYVTAHAALLQMLIVSARDPGHVHEAVGPAGNAALRSADCAVLIVNRQHL